MNHNDIKSLIYNPETNDESLKKEAENQKRFALEFLELLIKSIKDEASFLLKNKYISNDEEESFETNVNHILSLLLSANLHISKEGPSHFSDYLITSAFAEIVKYLPKPSVKNIINILKTSSTSNIVAASSEEQSVQHKKSDNKDFNNLFSYGSIALTSGKKQTSPINEPRRCVIDFCADLNEYRAYGIKRANRLGANLLQVQPNYFSAVCSKFTISKDFVLTLIGHCYRGSDNLSDNSGNKVDVFQIAQEIYLNMMRTNTPLDTQFTIDLIACQAASRRGPNASFAERLIDALSKYGINNVSVTASPTIMVATHDGREANVSVLEDRRLSSSIEEQHPRRADRAGRLFSPTVPVCDYTKLNVNKVTFRSINPGKK